MIEYTHYIIKGDEVILFNGHGHSVDRISIVHLLSKSGLYRFIGNV